MKKNGRNSKKRRESREEMKRKCESENSMRRDGMVVVKKMRL